VAARLALRKTTSLPTELPLYCARFIQVKIKCAVRLIIKSRIFGVNLLTVAQRFLLGERRCGSYLGARGLMASHASTFIATRRKRAWKQKATVVTLPARSPRSRFATDSPLEGDGFEPSVPREEEPFVETVLSDFSATSLPRGTEGSDLAPSAGESATPEKSTA
jgi:hypothetical protein